MTINTDQSAPVFHSLAAEDIAQHTETDMKNGLSTDAAAARLATYGENKLPASKPRHPVMRFLRHFHNTLIYVLLGAALITFMLGHYIDMAVIFAVVLANAIIGFIQEGKAEQAISAIRRMLAPHAAIMRDGKRVSVDACGLVPGDIVLLEAGDRVPADIRLFQANGLQIQESILTGESVPVEKSSASLAGDMPLGDRINMGFSGTMVTAGQGRGIVVATGGMTEIGRISGMLQNVETLTTPLIRQMNRFAKWLTGFILIFALAILAVGYFLQGQEFAGIFLAVVGLTVAAIPEGLPTVLTITLAIGVRAMAQRNAIVRRLPAIETLGSVSVICTDKTGTLTRNEMMAGTIAAARTLYDIDGAGYDPAGTITPRTPDAQQADLASYAASHAALRMVLKTALLCNDSALHQDESGDWQVQGDPMEGALQVMAGKAGLCRKEEESCAPRRDTIPFDAAHRFMATLHDGDDGKNYIFIKGAPEKILEMCDREYDESGAAVALDRDNWHECAAAIAARGERVLAFAVREAPAGQTALAMDDVAGGLILAGLVGLIDPPRPEAVDAVRDCRNAGISVKMITGDHAATAQAIGRHVGLEKTDMVLTGADIDTMDDATLADKVLETDIFARTSPHHKLRLVMALQSRAMVVAMTGDGVNDAPALKRADAGIAMGKTGSEAAKEASEIVLADDNFATLAAAVKAGRTVYDNLKKVILFLLPINGGESLSLVLAIMIGLTLPIAPVQILWVNMVSSVLLAMALAFEPPEKDVMNRPPRAPDEPILSLFLLWRILFVSLLFTVGIFGQFILVQMQGFSLEIARTMAVNTLVVMEVFYLFSIRYMYGTSLTLRGVLGTRAILIAVIAVTAAQCLFTYAPFMAFLFESAPLSLAQIMQVLAFGMAVLALLEIEKYVVRRLWQSKAAALPL